MGRLTSTLVWTLLVLGVPGAALAHGHPDHADPKVGSTVSVPPAEVRIWFDTDLEPAFSTVTVQGPNGAKVDEGGGHVDPSDHKLLTVKVARLPPGTYRVCWSIAARDGHRTSGDYTFTVR